MGLVSSSERELRSAIAQIDERPVARASPSPHRMASDGARVEASSFPWFACLDFPLKRCLWALLGRAWEHGK
jgi:hypothetical protein